MKVYLDIDSEYDKDEIIIKAKSYSEEIKQLYEQLKNNSSINETLLLYDKKKEVIVEIKDIYFFETENEAVYAHTNNDSYLCKLRLYELEEKLPHFFIRVSKSTIVNMKHIFSIEKSFNSSSRIQFSNCHKEVYISRRYYKSLKDKINERSFI